MGITAHGGAPPRGRFDAVVFDLFGTLVPQLPHEEFDRFSTELARIVGGEPERVKAQIRAEFPLRMNGGIRDGEQQFAPLAAALGLDVTQAQLQEAATVWHTFLDRGVTPKPGAIDVLEAVRARGLGLTLCTDCSSSTEARLDRTALGPYFAVRACSADLGAPKPDRRMYEHVIQGLGVAPERCVYVGDGGSNEHWGAAQFGMTTVWIDEPGAPVVHAAGETADHRVEALAALLPLL